MYFYWVRDKVRQGHYLVYWRIGKDNLVNYFTKHHPTKHQRAVRITYLSPTADARNKYCYRVPSTFQGCVEYLLYQNKYKRRTSPPPSTNGLITDGNGQDNRYYTEYT